MSGKKQHIIPQMIQRNFCEEDGKIYIYKKNKHYASNIIDNFAENYYYSDSIDSRLDDEITKDEAKNISTTLSQLKKYKINEVFDLDKNMGNFVLHMIKRNKFILEGVNKFLISDYVFNFINEKVKHIIINIIKKYQKKLNWTNEEITIGVESLLMKNHVKNNILSHLENFKEENKKNFHWGAISDTEINSSFFGEKYKYIVMESLEIVLPLPDTFMYLKKHECIENSDYMVFPITSNKFVVVFESILPNININDVVENLVFSSFGSFIVSRKNASDYFLSLSNKINKNMFAHHVDDLEKQDFFKDFFNDFKNGFEHSFIKKHNLTLIT